MSERAERAIAIYKSGHNCAQALAIAYADVLGMSEDKASAMFSGFGGGFGGQHEVCGAISAMTAVMGLLMGVTDGSLESKKRIYSRISTACKQFKKEHGSIICRDLLVQAKKTDPSPKPCSAHLATVCSLMDEAIGKRVFEPKKD